MSVHELKTWPEPFKAILDGRKRYEIRKNDRDYSIGDVLVLMEYQHAPDNAECTACGKTMASYNEFPEYQHEGCGGLVKIIDSRGYTGRWIRAAVRYITIGGQWGLPNDLCVMSIEVTQ